MYRPNIFNMTLYASSEGIKLIFAYCDGDCSEDYWIYKPEIYQISQEAQSQSFVCFEDTGKLTVHFGPQGLADGNVENSYRRLKGRLSLSFNTDQHRVELYEVDLKHENTYWQSHFNVSFDYTLGEEKSD